MVLKGEKVILRPIRLSDAGRFVKWLNDKEVYKYLQAHGRRLTMQKELKWIRQNLKDRTKKNFAIEAAGVHIGSTSLDINPANSRAVFGIVIGDKKYWNRGFGTDAARTIIDYGFKKLKLHRIELDVMEFNLRAMKVYKRVGFRTEGRLRKHNKYIGKFFDVIRMGLLKSEWKNLL